MILQVLLFDQLQLLGVCHPYIYVLCLLMMPITLSHSADMIIGAVAGLIMDIFCNSMGVHTAACIFIMFIRPYLIGAIVNDKDRLNEQISLRSLGMEALLRYVVILVVIHHLIVFLLAACLYGERPSLVQGAGMLVVFVGYFVFSWAGRHEGIDFLRSRAVWCAVAGMCFSALSAIWDKFIFRHDAGAPADPHLVESVQLLFQVGLVVVYGLLLAGTALGRRRARTGAPRFAWRWTIPCVGILLACADWLYFRGIHEDGVLISVASLMRRFSVVITFVLGAKFFHETNLLRKSLALAAVLLGIALICLGA